MAQGYKVFKWIKELRLVKKAKTKELNCLYALTDYIDCESLADTCEDNLAEIEDIGDDTKEDFEMDAMAAGLEVDELELMDPDARAEVLEEAGLDSDDYDFD